MNTTISVIVPAYNAASTLRFCLTALLQESDNAKEIIVMDDCSTDRSAEIGREMGAQVMRTPLRSGPAAARNLGALHAKGEILFFVDSDVVIGKGSVALVREVMENNRQISAMFGSYDDQPAEQNFLSQYKNLLHHFVHQNSDTDASTFWAGCGAIRKEVFTSLNGFNSREYPRPSIEDIELGIRLKRNNHSILLEKRLQGKHLKKWTVSSLLKADILDRAYPWSRLIARMGQIPNQLNLQISHRISSMLAGTFFATIFLAILFPSWWIARSAIFLLGIFIFLNRNLYGFLRRRKGFLFLPGAIFWHMLYYVYSAIIFVLCWIRFRILDPGARDALSGDVRMVSDEKR